MPESEACGAHLRTVSHPALIVFDLDERLPTAANPARESYKRAFCADGLLARLPMNWRTASTARMRTRFAG
ncbi:MAG: hypothetical protein ACLUHE_04820 [Christensenellales bacterium]